MAPTAESSITSPISNLPYDILLEIFAHCLQRRPLRHRQPETRIAPILLCHICSSWRTVALASPTLWTHLYYYFTILEDDDTDSASCTIAFNEREIEFIQWWRTNHGSIPPFLHLCVDDDDEDPYVYYLSDKPVVGGGMDFLLEYITSAQYLELDIFFWSHIHERIKAGYQVAFPNLHTLLMESGWNDAETDSFYHVQSVISTQAHSALRRLSIDNDIPPDYFVIPNHWSTLSHISLLRVSISLGFWFSLIRAVPSLRWGHFDFDGVTNINYTTPPQFTLLQLNTLSVAVRGILVDRSVFPLSLLFTGLSLPTLRTLSLSASHMKSWTDHLAITELYNVLKSAPAITKLTLGDDFFSLATRPIGMLQAAVENVKPVWIYATQLLHLQLGTPYIPLTTAIKDEKIILDTFIHNIFSSTTTWLDLQNPSCPIRTIIICTTGRTGDFTMSKILKNAPKTLKVAFQITDADSVEGAAVRNEWQSII